MKILNGKNLYTVINERYFDCCLSLLKYAKFEIKGLCDTYYNSKFQNKNNLWYIVELRYNEN